MSEIRINPSDIYSKILDKQEGLEINHLYSTNSGHQKKNTQVKTPADLPL